MVKCNALMFVTLDLCNSLNFSPSFRSIVPSFRGKAEVR